MRILLLCCFLFSALSVIAQPDQHQNCDETYYHPNPRPSHPIGQGPIVWIDEAHHNFHTMEGRYCAFTDVLQSDGYQVYANTRSFEDANLFQCDVLVISNALDEGTAYRAQFANNWQLPNLSAFTTEEIRALERWVAYGGSLFLIADHIPFPGCASELAAVFGFDFFNGYAEIDNRKNWPSQFRKRDGSLKRHPLTEGIDSIATFTGQGFRCPLGAEPILVFGNNHEIILPEQSGRPYSATAPRFSAKGLAQGAVMNYGLGRIAIFGEAAMFTAQTTPNNLKFGLNSPKAPNNEKFLLNILHWLENEGGQKIPQWLMTRIGDNTQNMELSLINGNLRALTANYEANAMLISSDRRKYKGRSKIESYWKQTGALSVRMASIQTTYDINELKQCQLWQKISPATIRNWSPLLRLDPKRQGVYQIGTTMIRTKGSDGHDIYTQGYFARFWQQQPDGSYQLLVDCYGK